MVDISTISKAQKSRIKLNEMLGNKFGNLTVIKLDSLRGKRNVAFYLCKCVCGKEVVVCGSTLRKKNVQHSCHDCNMAYIHNKQTTHHQTNTTLYRIYRSMKNRCLNNKNYYARGIKVCDEWANSFESFYKWALTNGWKEIKTSKNYSSLTIDRIDNNGNYEPSNCRFVEMREQQNNKRNNHLIEYKGKTQNITQWCEELGLNRNTVYGQINYQKLTLEDILRRK